MSRVHHQQGGEPSQRMLRVAELIRHTMAELLVRSAIGDPVLESQPITIPEVRMSPISSLPPFLSCRSAARGSRMS